MPKQHILCKSLKQVSGELNTDAIIDVKKKIITCKELRISWCFTENMRKKNICN